VARPKIQPPTDKELKTQQKVKHCRHKQVLLSTVFRKVRNTGTVKNRFSSKAQALES
jgi:hypothetical protein